MAIQAADELVSWEHQVKSSAETKSLVHRYALFRNNRLMLDEMT